MKHYNFIFIVLVYRNTQDIHDFKKSLTNVIGSYKVVVVNSYYDNNSFIEFKKICQDHDFDFINVPNEGYGAGNNRGIEFAKNRYNFDFIIVSNSDIEIKKLNINSIISLDESILGPQIITLTGKDQNPSHTAHLKPVEFFKKASAKYDSKLLFYTAVGINKIYKIFHRVFSNKNVSKEQPQSVYGLHGAFLIFSYKAIEKLSFCPFDSRMFLFAEEDYLAKIALLKGIRMLYCPWLYVRHKEDGSVGLLNKDLLKIQLESLRCLYFGE